MTRVSRDTATVRVQLDTLDVDACGNDVPQTFSGTWTVELVGGIATLTDSEIEKDSGGTPITSAARCEPVAPPPPPEPAASTPSGDCHPSYQGACLDPSSSDYDCASGSGDGPDYVDGPISVVGSDDYGLDSDSDRTACE